MSLTGLLFLACFAGGCLLAVARHPIFGLMTYVGVFYLHPPSRWWGEALPDLRWSLLAAAVTLVGAVVHRKALSAVPLFRQPPMIGMLVFLVWLIVQSMWAINERMHPELVTLWVKYVVLIGLIYKCIDSERNLRLFLWAHVLGCFYLGMIAFERYTGGRFEGFGGPGISEANSGALVVVTGIFTAASLFLAGRLGEKAATVGCMPFIVNALITTLSRSGFLAVATAGLAFNFFAPKRFRKRIRALSLLGAVLFVTLTNPVYWERIGTILYFGEEVEDVNTGSRRVALIEAQWQMFLDNPMGCGHRCTPILSVRYLPDEYLLGVDGLPVPRASHNTVMTLLVEQGPVGVVLYALLLVWIFVSLRKLLGQLQGQSGFQACVLPCVAGVLIAITIGDGFVDYLKLEVRFWFMSILMVMLAMASVPRLTSQSADTGSQRAPAGSL